MAHLIAGAAVSFARSEDPVRQLFGRRSMVPREHMRDLMPGIAAVDRRAPGGYTEALMKLARLSPVFGAEVGDVDLRAIGDPDFEQIYAAWVEHGVLRFRDQHLDDRELEAFSARFGPLEKIPLRLTPEQERRVPSLYVTPISNVRVDGRPIGGLGNAEANWHSDMTYLPTPPPASVLLGVEIPTEGGDTHFACQHAALEALPAELRERIANVRIKHDAAHTSIGELRAGFDEVTDPARLPRAQRTPRFAATRRTDATRSTSVAVSTRTSRGCRSRRARRCSTSSGATPRCTSATWTQEWEVGDVVVWDNRRVLHRRDAFPDDMRRMLRRCQVLAREAS